MFFYNPAERETVNIAKGVNGKSFWGDQLMLVVVDLEPNSIIPSHSHPNEQAGLVLSGEIILTIAGDSKLLKVGDIYLIPETVEHSAKTGSDPTQVLDIFTPIREDLK